MSQRGICSYKCITHIFLFVMMKVAPHIVLFLCLWITVACEIFSLQHKNQVRCYTRSTSPIYLSPPLNEKNNVKESEEKWLHDDWTIKESNDSSFGSVTDKRWQAFPFTTGNIYHLRLTHSTSFSILPPTSLEVFMNIDDQQKTFELNKTTTRLCSHYTFFLEDHRFLILENNHIVEKFTNLKPKFVTVKSKEDISWKIHEYSFRESNVTSTVPSSLVIPPSDTSCLMIYTSMCNTCILEISISDTKNVKEVDIFPTESSILSLKDWKETIITINPKTETKLTFLRKNIRNSTHGHWNLDVKLCPAMVGTTGLFVSSFEAQNETKAINHTCHTLEDTELDSTFCDKPGYLGTKCDISCEDILGSDFKYCHQHKICQNSVCHCAWGYQGSSCFERCQNGTWGPSCNNSCESDCTSCDEITGTCNDDRYFTTTNVIIINTGIIIIVLVVVTYFHNKSSRMTMTFHQEETKKNNSDGTEIMLVGYKKTEDDTEMTLLNSSQNMNDTLNVKK